MKIALCCPVHGHIPPKFTNSLVQMVIFTLGATIEVDGERVRPELDIFMVSCSMLPESRNRLVVEAIAWGADYMLWLDADHIFPADALLRLMSRSKLVVGVNYSRRFIPTSPTASRLTGEDDKLELVYTTKDLVDADTVEEVAHIGMGLCLVDMRVFGALEHKAHEDGREHFWPLFDMEPRPDGIGFTGEDVQFFESLRAAGIAVYLDHALSWEVGHIDEQILTCAHAVAQRDRHVAWDKGKHDYLKTRAGIANEAPVLRSLGGAG